MEISRGSDIDVNSVSTYTFKACVPGDAMRVALELSSILFRPPRHCCRHRAPADSDLEEAYSQLLTPVQHKQLAHRYQNLRMERLVSRASNLEVRAVDLLRRT